MTKLTNDTLYATLEQHFPGLLSNREESYGMLAFETTRESILDVLRYAKEAPELQFIFLTTLCGMHFPEQSGRELAVVYHLHSFRHNLRFRVKVFFPIDDPYMPSATALWPAANWMERETYDFFGIQFNGHPDLRRILNVDDLDVFPLRKEYRLEDGTRTDKDDRFFGRDGHEGRRFD